ncbi:MAG: hypothetical protein JXA21_05990 [Anaerolineae bacterium]|nr:hypothetical protein [Anaerolineae bacterium]
MKRRKSILNFALVLLIAAFWSAPALNAPSAPMAYNPNELSYGLYWFGVNNANAQYVAGQPNAYFDPARPTLIFVHGWQPYLSYNLPNFDANGVDTAAAWVADGWNVGLFVWNQFSDETTGVAQGGDWFGESAPQGVLDAEAKIWTPDGPQGMRWRDWDDVLPGADGYSAAPSGTPSAGELFYNTYAAAMTNEGAFTGGAIRVAGHSLGNQMAVRLAKQVHDHIAAGEIGEELRVTRVALLDPYWSPTPKTYLDGKSNAQVVRESIAEMIPDGTLFEWYWSSPWTMLPQGDTNDALKPLVLYAALDPQYAANDKDKHMAAQYHYFDSYAFAGPAACTGEDCLAMTKLLSKMSDAQLGAAMRSDYRWAQTGGQLTATSEDDTFAAAFQTGALYIVTALDLPAQTVRVGDVVTLAATVVSGTSTPADNVLVAISSDWGEVTPRAVANDGTAQVQLQADAAGVAHLTATTRGAGGDVQARAVVTFTAPVTVCVPISEVAVVEATPASTFFVGMQYTFQSVITPANATPPITYTWSPAPLNGQNQATATYRWDTPGVYTVTLSAANCVTVAVDAPPREVVVTEGAYRLYLPLVLRSQD